MIIVITLTATILVPTNDFVAVVMPPWSTAKDTINTVTSAGGSLVASARFDWIMIAHSPDGDFVNRLHENGAWFVLNHNVVSGCFQDR